MTSRNHLLPHNVSIQFDIKRGRGGRSKEECHKTLTDVMEDFLILANAIMSSYLQTCH